MTNGTYYEILGVAPHVGLGQLQAAYRFSKALYAGDGMATYGLLDASERARMLALVEEAYGVLSDASARRAYDIELQARDVRVGGPAPRLKTPPAPSPARPSPARSVATQTEPAASPAAPPPSPSPSPDVPEPPLHVPGTVNGAALRALREHRGLSIDQIAALSKVGGRFLRALEEDRHEVLPGRVFARGFLIEYARALRVSESELVDRYLRHWTGR